MNPLLREKLIKKGREIHHNQSNPPLSHVFIYFISSLTFHKQIKKRNRDMDGEGRKGIAVEGDRCGERGRQIRQRGVTGAGR